jgi:quercetin dioxygenase-like cupin family protein
MRPPPQHRHSLHPIRVLAIASIALMCVATNLYAQGGKKGKKELKWGPAPEVFPKGAEMAVQKGDPTKSGEFIVLLKFPDGYRIPPHSHPTDEHIKVREGTFLVGMGDKLDESKTKALAVGDTAYMPAKMRHFAIAKGPTEVSVRAEGPFAMTYVNPADKPKP